MENRPSLGAEAVILGLLCSTNQLRQPINVNHSLIYVIKHKDYPQLFFFAFFFATFFFNSLIVSLLKEYFQPCNRVQTYLTTDDWR